MVVAKRPEANENAKLKQPSIVIEVPISPFPSQSPAVNCPIRVLRISKSTTPGTDRQQCSLPEPGEEVTAKAHLS
jgi:hypothetical protein